LLFYFSNGNISFFATFGKLGPFLFLISKLDSGIISLELDIEAYVLYLNLELLEKLNSCLDGELLTQLF
jgi:hypothetical protein